MRGIAVIDADGRDVTYFYLMEISHASSGEDLFELQAIWNNYCDVKPEKTNWNKEGF